MTSCIDSSYVVGDYLGVQFMKHLNYCELKFQSYNFQNKIKNNLQFYDDYRHE